MNCDSDPKCCTKCCKYCRCGISLLLLLALPVLSGCVYHDLKKSYWDDKIREMCEKDGGVRILEKVNITAAEVTTLPHVAGRLAVASKESSPIDSPVYSEETTTYLNFGNPEVRRQEITIVRRADSRVVAKWVYYARRGGDAPSIAHDSHFGCPELRQITQDLGHLFILDGVPQ